MTAQLLAAADAPITFVMGKGGVGKTTTAGALAVGHATAGRAVLLLSTDPAHSTADVLAVPPGSVRDGLCGGRLTLEEFDARAWGDRWTRRVAPELTALVEGGTYLDAEDARHFLELSLPGIDEVMAALRLAEGVPGDALTIIDTAPTGHALRLLGSAALIRSWADALDAMARKAGAVARAFTGGRAGVEGERLVAELRERADQWETLLRAAAAVIVTRDGDVVTAETRRLADGVERFGVRRAAIVCVATDAGRAARLDLPDGVRFAVPPDAPTAPGCDALRGWLASAVPVAPVSGAREDGAREDGAREARGRDDGGREAGTPVTRWLELEAPGLLFVAGKGGVGKSTCAAALALRLARVRPVLLYSTDPAGSLGDVLGVEIGAEARQVAGGLRARQLDAGAALAELKDEYEREVTELFDGIGIGGDATLDRRVALSIWEMAPPGIDEIAALIGILEAGEAEETIVVDAAPTGHFLRLLQMPGLALDWTHALMRVLLKYRMAGSLETLAARVLALARQLRALQVTLAEPDRAGAIIVTLDEPLVAAETGRLAAALEDAGIALCARIVNRGGHATGPAGVRTIRAPLLDAPPVGSAGLEHFLETWEFAG